MKLRKCISLIVCIAIFVGLLPTTVFASDNWLNEKSDFFGVDGAITYSLKYGNIEIGAKGAIGKTTSGKTPKFAQYSKTNEYIIEGSENEEDAIKLGYHITINPAEYARIFGSNPTIYLRNPNGKSLYIYAGSNGVTSTSSYTPAIYIGGGYTKMIVQCPTFLKGADVSDSIYGASAIHVSGKGSLGDTFGQYEAGITGGLDLVLENHLTATGGGGASAIGASGLNSGGSVRISANLDSQDVNLNAYAGKISMPGMSGSAGIGTGTNTSMRAILIDTPHYTDNAKKEDFKLKINAFGIGGGAGIGSGYTFGGKFSGGVDFIQIADSPDDYCLLEIDAVGGRSYSIPSEDTGAAGIGSGKGSYKSVIKVNNGTVNAYGGNGAAGIGGGCNTTPGIYKVAKYSKEYYNSSPYDPSESGYEIWYEKNVSDGIIPSIPAKCSLENFPSQAVIQQQKADIEIHGGKIYSETQSSFEDAAGIGGGKDEVLAFDGNIKNTDFADLYKSTNSSGLQLIQGYTKKIKNYQFGLEYQTSVIIDHKEIGKGGFYDDTEGVKRPLTTVKVLGGIGGGNNGTAYVEIDGGSVSTGGCMIGGGENVPNNSGSFVNIKDGYVYASLSGNDKSKEIYTRKVMDGGSLRLSGNTEDASQMLYNSDGKRLYSTNYYPVELSGKEQKIASSDFDGRGFSDQIKLDGVDYTLKSTPTMSHNEYTLWLPEGKYNATKPYLQGYSFYGEASSNKTRGVDYSIKLKKDKTTLNLKSFDYVGDGYSCHVNNNSNEVKCITSSFGNNDFSKINILSFMEQASSMPLGTDFADNYNIYFEDDSVISTTNENGSSQPGILYPHKYGTTKVIVVKKANSNSNDGLYYLPRAEFTVNVCKPTIGGSIVTSLNSTNGEMIIDSSKITCEGSNNYSLQANWYDMSTAKLINSGMTYTRPTEDAGKMYYIVVKDKTGNVEGQLTKYVNAPLISLQLKHNYYEMDSSDVSVDITGVDSNGFIKLSDRINATVNFRNSFYDGMSEWYTFIWQMYDPNEDKWVNIQSDPSSVCNYNICNSFGYKNIGKKVRLVLEAERISLDPNDTKHQTLNHYMYTNTYNIGTIIKNDTNFILEEPKLDSRTTSSIKLVANYMHEYSIDGINWNYTGLFENLEESTTYNIYYRIYETASSFGTPAKIVKYSTETVQHLETPKAELHLENRLITNLNSYAQVSFDGGESWIKAETDTMRIITELSKGDTVLVKDIGDDGLSCFDSEEQTITVDKMEPPKFTVEHANVDNKKGVINGLTDTVMYRQKGSEKWDRNFGTSLCLSSGKWEIKYDAKNNLIESDIVDVEILVADNNANLDSLEITTGESTRKLTTDEIKTATTNDGLDIPISDAILSEKDITLSVKACSSDAVVVSKIIASDGIYYAKIVVLAQDNKTAQTYLLNFHIVNDEWKYDDTQHWKECECGNKFYTEEHSSDTWVIDKEPTYTQTGYKHKVCDICGKSFANSTIIPALSDTVFPEINGIENGKVYYTTQKVTVTDENLNEVRFNDAVTADTEFILEGNCNKIYTITATDKAGNSSFCTVTMKKISDIVHPIDSINKSNVTIDDKNMIENVRATANEVNTINASSEEINELSSIIAKCDELLDTINNLPDSNIIGILGDCTQDGKVDISDATAIQKYLASIIELTDTQLVLANVDKNGCDLSDADLITRYCVGLIDNEKYGVGNTVYSKK